MPTFACVVTKTFNSSNVILPPYELNSKQPFNSPKKKEVKRKKQMNRVPSDFTYFRLI
jgi:hypothetical protein